MTGQHSMHGQYRQPRPERVGTPRTGRFSRSRRRPPQFPRTPRRCRPPTAGGPSGARALGSDESSRSAAAMLSTLRSPRPVAQSPCSRSPRDGPCACMWSQHQLPQLHISPIFYALFLYMRTGKQMCLWSHVSCYNSRHHSLEGALHLFSQGLASSQARRGNQETHFRRSAIT